jgi:hypothetical protein
LSDDLGEFRLEQGALFELALGNPLALVHLKLYASIAAAGRALFADKHRVVPFAVWAFHSLCI